jgi:hypothetical protein
MVISDACISRDAGLAFTSTAVSVSGHMAGYKISGLEKGQGWIYKASLR